MLQSLDDWQAQTINSHVFMVSTTLPLVSADWNNLVSSLRNYKGIEQKLYYR